MSRAALVCAVVLLAAAAACGPRRPAQRAVCAGQRTALISNNWSETVDVKALPRNRTVPLTLGSVMSGEHAEFAVPDSVDYVYVQNVRTPPSMAPRNSIVLRYECRK